MIAATGPHGPLDEPEVPRRKCARAPHPLSAVPPASVLGEEGVPGVAHLSAAAGRRSRSPRASTRGDAGEAAGARTPGKRGTGKANQAAIELAATVLALDDIQTRIRRALLDEPLEQGLAVATRVLAEAFAPAATQIWLTEQTPWIGELSRPGGQELFPLLRQRAAASTTQARRQAIHVVAPEGSAASASALPVAPAIPASATATAADALIEEVAASRRPLVTSAPAAVALARAWLGAHDLATTDATDTASTLAAYPLLVRDQLLGVLVVGTARTLDAHALALLATIADLCAVAAEHASLVSYSRGQEALAQTVVRQAPVAIAVLTGHQHLFALANPAFAQLLGVEGSLRGRRLEDVVSAHEHLRERLRLDAVYATGEPQAMIELPIHLERGLTYWNVTSSALPGRTARVGGVLVAAVDMTHQVLERRRAVEAAETAQTRLRQMTALHATSLAVAGQLGADPRDLLADILRRSMALLNARAGTVYVVDARVGQLEAIVCEGLRGAYVGRRTRLGHGLAGQVASAGQGVVVDDIRLYAASPVMYVGESVSAVIAVPLIQRGRVVGVLEVLDDAERHTFTPNDLWLLELFASQAAQAIENSHTYDELERAYAAQRELDRMKDDFIATASHELRTPLTGIQGFLDLLLDYPGSRDEPLALEFLTRATESTAELTQLTTQLLQTARLDSGALETQHEPVALRAAIDEVVRAQDAVLASVEHPPALEVSDVSNLTVLADSDRLGEVLANLVGNAIKYSPAGGVIRIACVPLTGAELLRELATTSAAFVPPEDDTRYALVTVADQGMGIPRAGRDQLFGRFARLEAARTSQIRGTGLGLYICRQLMHAMGGYIWLRDSLPGAGSTFALALPLADRTPHP